MTVISAIHDTDQNCVWVGSNDRAMLGSLVGPSVDKKWVALGGWLIGITGTGPKIEALKACADDVPQSAAHPFEILRFIKGAYDKFDIGEMEEGLKRYCGSGLLIHKSGAIWDFDNSLCLTDVPSGKFWARGSGMDIAIGAAVALTPFIKSPKDLTQRVLEIVTANDVDCPGDTLVQCFDANGVLSDPVS